MVFVIVVFSLHKLVAKLCARFTPFRHFIRGTPRALVRDGVVIESALIEEEVSLEELNAGLRKLGFDSAEKVRVAMLEETGHISAIKR